MAVSEQSTDYLFDEEEDYSECGESEPEDDTDKDLSYGILEETDAMFSNLSIKKKKSEARIFEDVDTGSRGDSDELEVVVPELDEKDVQSFERVQKIIEAGQLEKLKVDQCKVYLRKNGLRLTGTKGKLIQRIREHLEILNGGGEMKYPVSSFVLNCKGDACTGDVVMFEQNVYEMFNIASRSAGGPPIGTRTVVGRIVKESYGAAKQQHTFTIEVLWSKGDKPLPPLHPLLIKGRNLYRLKTLRQTWEDERERQKVMMEKHLRGSTARCDREARLQEKETRKMLKATRVSRKESNRNQSQFNSTSTAKSVVQLPQAGLQECKRMLTQQAGLSFEPRQRMTHPQQQKHAIQSNHHLQQPSQNFTESRRASCTERVSNYSQGVHRANYKPPDFCSNDSQASISIYPYINGTNVSSERTHYRQPLTTINHFAPGSQLHRQGHTRQLCRYYAQGRCYYGDNCKFVHNSRRSYGQSTEER